MMASTSSPGGVLFDTNLTTMASEQQTSSSKKCSKKAKQNNTKSTINRPQEQLLTKLSGSRGRDRNMPVFEPVSRILHTAEPDRVTSPPFPSCSGALPCIPEIRIEIADARDARADAGGSVSPPNHRQSRDHLRVPSRLNPLPKRKRQAVRSGTGRKRTFLCSVDRALGLHHVRTYGDQEPLGVSRYRAKRNTFRIIALFGVLMMLSLLASITLFVYFASKGGAGPEWFAWIGVSAAGWIWSFLAFMMAKRSKKRVLHDVEIARQSIRLKSRVRYGTAAPVAIIGGPGANRQQVMRAGSGAAADHSVVTAGGATPEVLGKHRRLETIQEEGWAQDTEERLDMLVRDRTPQGGDGMV
ncbi:hypothetical protein LZ30DRAFT_63877 [Colletotrichum cereale]|nr:hypothetical protein LZ30DRAFT_63877 [Colletotrichum cereale]